MSSNAQSPSKGPPPLPTNDLPEAPFAAPLGDVADVAEVEEAFFLEGIDGHADSLPESEAATIALAPIGQEPLKADAEAEQANADDPARAKRRRAARIGVAWGTVVMVAAFGTTAFMGRHAHERTAVATLSAPTTSRPAPVDEVATLSHATAPTPLALTTPSYVSPELPPADAVASPHPTVHATTASTKAVAAPHPRAASHGTINKKNAAPSHGAKATAATKVTAATKAAAAHASASRAPATRVAASKSRPRGATTPATTTKASG